MAVCEKPSLRKVTTCWYPARRSSRFAWLSAVAFGLADRAAVWVAQFPVAWLLTPQFGGFDTLPDDVPAIPPGLLQDFSTSGTCPHTGWLGEHHWLPQKHSRRRDLDPTRVNFRMRTHPSSGGFFLAIGQEIDCLVALHIY